MNIIIIDHGEDNDLVVYGPFLDLAWAEAWLKQHSHNPYADEPPELDPVYEELVTKREEDEDHWCIMGLINHEISTIHTPGFDPTTLPGGGATGK